MPGANPAGRAGTLLRVLASLVASLALAAVPASAPATAAASPCAGAYEQTDPVVRRHAVQCLVNNVRAAHGLRRLRASRTLTRAAGGHARDMVRRDFFEHTSPGGSTPSDRALRAGYRGLYVGETIAFAVGEDATPVGTVRGWMASAAHRPVILDRDMRHIGVGIADGAPADGGSTAEGATVVLDVGGPA